MKWRVGVRISEEEGEEGDEAGGGEDEEKRRQSTENGLTGDNRIIYVHISVQVHEY